MERTRRPTPSSDPDVVLVCEELLAFRPSRMYTWGANTVRQLAYDLTRQACLCLNEKGTRPARKHDPEDFYDAFVMSAKAYLDRNPEIEGNAEDVAGWCIPLWSNHTNARKEEDIFHTALAKAQADTRPPALAHRRPVMVDVANLCRHLHEVLGGATFVLPVDWIARAMDCSRMYASAIRRTLIDLGVIEKVEEHRPNLYASGYRYTLPPDEEQMAHKRHLCGKYRVLVWRKPSGVAAAEAKHGDQHEEDDPDRWSDAKFRKEGGRPPRRRPRPHTTDQRPARLCEKVVAHSKKEREKEKELAFLRDEREAAHLALLDRLEVQYITEGPNCKRGWVNVRCPFCDDPSEHLGMNLETGAFNCWRCGKKVKSAALAKVAGISQAEAKKFLAQCRRRRREHV